MAKGHMKGGTGITLTGGASSSRYVIVVTSLDRGEEGKIAIGSVLDGHFDPSLKEGDFVSFSPIYDSSVDGFIADQVKPDSSIRGVLVTGNVPKITVAQGMACVVSNANVAGNIEMDGGLLLVADNSVVTGKIKALTNSVQVTIMDSTCKDVVKIQPTTAGSYFIAKNSSFAGTIKLSPNMSALCIQSCKVADVVLRIDQP